MSDDADVLILGAGLSGLALATALTERGVRVRVLEASDRAGGNLRTRIVDAPGGRWLLDLGPNSFGEKSEALVGLARRAGLEDRMVRAPDTADRRFLWRDGRLHEVPSNPLKFLTSGLLPFAGRMRMTREPFVPPRPRDAPEETLAEFCDRRLGRAAREKLLTAVVGGIYAGDPEELGAESAFPAMVALEREHGSLIRAAMHGKGPPSRGRLSSFADGLAELPAALEHRLGGRVTTGAPARRVVRDGDRWRVETEAGDFSAPRLAVTTPAARTAEILAGVDATLAAELTSILYAPMAVVHVGVRIDRIPRAPEGFGFLVPRNEGLRILGAIFSSVLFPGRAPPEHALVTVFTGGRLDAEAPSLDDAALRAFILADLGRAIGLTGEPALFEVTRWPRAIPQYVVGHKDRVARIDAAVRALPGLRLLGNWRGGIAMPDCVRNAEAVAAEWGS